MPMFMVTVPLAAWLTGGTGAPLASAAVTGPEAAVVETGGAAAASAAGPGACAVAFLAALPTTLQWPELILQRSSSRSRHLADSELFNRSHVYPAMELLRLLPPRLGRLVCSAVWLVMKNQNCGIVLASSVTFSFALTCTPFNPDGTAQLTKFAREFPARHSTTQPKRLAKPVVEACLAVGFVGCGNASCAMISQELIDRLQQRLLAAVPKR